MRKQTEDSETAAAFKGHQETAKWKPSEQTTEARSKHSCIAFREVTPKTEIPAALRVAAACRTPANGPQHCMQGTEEAG